MSMQEEIAAAPRICQFDPDEELYGAFFGTVHGPGIDGREGILYWTNQRVGLSVTAGWFDGEAFVSTGMARIKSIQVDSDGDSVDWGDTITVKTLDGKLKVSLENCTGDTFAATLDALRYHLRQFIRVDHLEKHEQAIACIEAGDLPGAHTHLDALVSKQPDRSPALLLRAYVRMDLGQTVEAIADLQKVLELGTPDRGSVHVSLAQCASRLDDSEAVVRHATMACEQYDDAEGWRVRGAHHLDNFETGAAATDLRRATALLPDDPQTWWLWARLGLLTANVAYVEQARASFERLENSVGVRNCDVAAASMREKFESCLQLGTKLLDARELEQLGAYAMVTAILMVGKPSYRALVPRIEETAGDGLFVLLAGLTEIGFGDYTALAARLAQLPAEALELPAFAQLVSFRDILKPDAVVEETLDRSGDLLKRLENPGRTRLFDELKPHVQWIRANALLQTERPAEARRLLQEVEAARPKSRFWTDLELEQLLARAYAATVGRSKENGNLGASAPPSKATTPYEVARRLADHLNTAPSLRTFASKASELLAHFDEPPLITVMGEYSVGKSTFINALVGRDLLPSGEGVTTGAITWLRYGNPERVRIVLFDGTIRELPGARSVADAVRETGGSDDFIRKVKYVEVFLDAPVLQKVHIVDSPGLNAPFKEHQKLTEDFLEDADAVLFLFNVEQAGRSTEADFLKRVSEHRRKAVAVVNQIDLVPKDELAEVMEDLEDELGEHFAAIMGVSALQALKGQLQDKERLLTKSKMPELRSFLDDNLLSEARELKVSATAVKLDELCMDLESELRERAAAVDDEATRIKGCIERFNQWTREELADTLTQSERTVSAGLDHAIDDAAVALAELATSGRLNVGSINGVARLFEQEVQRLVKAQQESLSSTVDGVMEQLSLDLQGTGDWMPVHSPGLRALRSERERAGSVLELHMDAVRAFCAGFVEGRGFFAGLFTEMSDDNRSNSEAVATMLRSRTDSLRSRSDSEQRRWANELRERLAVIVSEMETATRREGVRIREQEFRPALALRGSLGLGPPPVSVDTRGDEPSQATSPPEGHSAQAANALSMDDIAKAYREYTRLRHLLGHSNAAPFPRFRAMVEETWAKQRREYPTATLQLTVMESGGKARLVVRRLG